MDFKNPMFEMPDTTSPAQPQSTLGGVVSQAPGNFDQIAKSMQVNVSGLHANQDLARLQLAQRLQKQFGPDYGSHEGVQSLLKAYDSVKPPKADALTKMDHNAADARADRTLGELLK